MSLALVVSACARESAKEDGLDDLGDTTATAGGDSSADTSDGAEAGDFDMSPIPDLPAVVCEGAACWAYDLGECEAGDVCEESGHSCAFKHGGPGAPGACALKAETLAGIDEPCETYDAVGLQTCVDGFGCMGAKDSSSGACAEWCTSGQGADVDSTRGTCSRVQDVCIQHNLIEIGPQGGWCARRCNPTIDAPCGSLVGHSCHEVGDEVMFTVNSPDSFQNYVFTCVATDPGSAGLREDCSTLQQHHPDLSDDLQPQPCAAGLTCARYKFADEFLLHYQCIQLCDAPEDCLPTETCVSSLEFTESVGEPVGVCEVM